MISDARLRYELAIEICDQIWNTQHERAAVINTTCPDCRAFLIQYVDQNVAFCWGCTTDKAASQKAKQLLMKLKASSDIISYEPKKYSAESYWPEGWAM